MRDRQAKAQPCFMPLTMKGDRKSTRLNSSHLEISYAVFCLNKKTPCPLAGRRRGRLELEGAVMEPLGADASSLELEQEAKAGLQKLVDIVDRHRVQGIWLDR